VISTVTAFRQSSLIPFFSVLHAALGILFCFDYADAYPYIGEHHTVDPPGINPIG